jgi:hypothetical protein
MDVGGFMRSPALLSIGATTLVVGALLVLSASCGSRTGLFGVDNGTGGGGSGTGQGDGQADGPIPCVPGTFTIDLATAQLMFVVDRSGSMAFSIPGQDPVPPGQLSRWQTLRDALATTIAPFDQQIAMGAKFFPEVLPPDSLGDPTASCRTDTGVGIPPSLGNAQQILNVFDTTEPRGGTPTSEALRLASDYLSGRRGIARTIVLATDGAPNCNGALDAQSCTCTTQRNDCNRTTDGQYSCLDDQRTEQQVGTIFQTEKIPVYVIGIGGLERPEFSAVLDAMAVAGGRPRSGTPKYYSVQTEGEMTTALTTIRDSIAKCTYLTPSAPTDPNAITVEVDGKPVTRDPSHVNGWDWVDQAYGEIAFFGPACDSAAGNPTAHVTGTVSCTTH